MSPMMRMIALLTLISLTLSASTAQACWDTVAQKYNIAPSLLHAIAEQESSLNNLAVNFNAPNAQGVRTRDVCIMGINSGWFPTLKKRFGITEEALRSSWCTCLDVGAWILAQNCKTGMTWNCVGSYNAVSPEKKQRYALAIYRRLQHLGPNKSSRNLSSPTLRQSDTPAAISALQPFAADEY